jgi:hypothetical protein
MSPLPGPVCSTRIEDYIAELRANQTHLSRRHGVSKHPRHRTRAGRIQQTDPRVWAELNAEFGTQVDFSKVAQFEGGQWLHGYIPKDPKTGAVLGQSGLTIATGFDVGQFSVQQIKTFHFGPIIEQILLPYAGLKRDAAVAKLDEATKRDGHGPTLTKAEADLIDKVIKGYHLRAAKGSWNSSKPATTAKFEELTVAQQTVIFSRTFHQGPAMPKTKVAHKFYEAAQNGQWEEAEKALRAYAVKDHYYQQRVNTEADLLERERKAKL